MRVLNFMETLLALEAEAKYLLGIRDVSSEQTFTEELAKILVEAEFLFGPRDRSSAVPVPRMTECFTALTLVFPPLRTTRIYLTRDSKIDPRIASLELAHEAIHVMSPPPIGCGPTFLEEGLAEWFAYRYVNRVYGIQLGKSDDSKYDAALRAVSPLLAKNEFVIKELRSRQPVISKIDEKLLVEVAGIAPGHAKFLATDFQSYGRTPTPWGLFTAQAEFLADVLSSFLGTNRTK